VSSALPWRFKPENTTEKITIGARDMAAFTATNLSSKPVTGTATFNVTPTQAGRYFAKVQCFCFTEQTLEPGQTVRMPVIYYVDPAILTDPDTKDIEEITLSYTFYPLDQAKKGS
jgi:cytochrome c oxidase assembly protein subunit 11